MIDWDRWWRERGEPMLGRCYSLLPSRLDARVSPLVPQFSPLMRKTYSVKDLRAPTDPHSSLQWVFSRPLKIHPPTHQRWGKPPSPPILGIFGVSSNRRARDGDGDADNKMVATIECHTGDGEEDTCNQNALAALLQLLVPPSLP